MIELAVAADHVPSLPDADVVLPDEFRKLLVHQASLAWPRPRIHFASAMVSAIWYLATLAFLAMAGVDTVGPELIVGLAAAGLLVMALQYLVVSRRAALPAAAGSTQLPSPPELSKLVAQWGISNLAIWLRDDYRIDDHAVRVRATARIGVSREVFNRPGESGFVVAHELAHLLRNDPVRGLIDRRLRYSLLLPALVTFTPWIWAVTVASVLVHAVVKSWAAEIGCDLIAVKLHGYPQMMSFGDRIRATTHWPTLSHPPYPWRLWLARRARPTDPPAAS